jgi:hypothetical protein
VVTVIRDTVWKGYQIYWTLTGHYDNLAELHSPKLTVATAQIKSQSLLAADWYRLPTAGDPLPLGVRTVPASATGFPPLTTATLN